MVSLDARLQVNPCQVPVGNLRPPEHVPHVQNKSDGDVVSSFDPDGIAAG